MSSEGPPATSPRPSVFISYASEDRTAARVLRDALEAAGVEVWYDESDLGGGDAWDQKIRRQIRECDYFMPLVSANTEARKEGYFRREWRLATERMMDMADDVLFLLPVALDDTREAGARVPEKFLHVQWLRLPGGQPTAAFSALVGRIRAGDHRLPPRIPISATRPPMSLTPPAPPMTPPHLGAAPAAPAAAPESSARTAQPPPVPPLPPVPEKGGFAHGLRYVLELCWWVVSAGWALSRRLPRWLRILLAVWIVLTFFSRCERGSPTSVPAKPQRVRAASSVDLKKAIQVASETVAAATPPGTETRPDHLVRIGREIARTLARESAAHGAAAKPVLLVPFARGMADEGMARFATAVFASCYGQLLVARPDAAAITEAPAAAAGDSALATLGQGLGAEFVLTAHPAAPERRALAVRLLRVRDASVAWSGEFPVEDGDAAAAAESIADGVLELLPPR